MFSILCCSLGNGIVLSFLPIYHYIFVDFSRPVAPVAGKIYPYLCLSVCLTQSMHDERQWRWSSLAGPAMSIAGLTVGKCWPPYGGSSWPPTRRAGMPCPLLPSPPPHTQWTTGHQRFTLHTQPTAPLACRLIRQTIWFYPGINKLDGRTH